jgi:hypothetical protein
MIQVYCRFCIVAIIFGILCCLVEHRMWGAFVVAAIILYLVHKLDKEIRG